MKTCANCGAHLPDDELFCPRCGEEVQLVPIFQTMETSIKEQQRILEEKEKERLAILAMEEEERTKAAKKRNIILFSSAFVVIVVAAFFGLSFLLKTSTKSAFNSRYTKALDCYNSGDYTGSMELITEALEKDPGNLEGKILLADIYAAQGKTDMALALLTEVIDENPTSEAAYRKLIGMYEAMGQTNNIQLLLGRCQEESILEKFSDYYCKAPEFSLESAEFKSVQNLELTADEGTNIYYTLDGSDPTAMSLHYTDSILLSGGDIKVRAIAINSKGIPSVIKECSYTINVKTVKPPVVYPRANSFTYSDGKTHKFTVIIPKGFRAYYSFDGMPSTVSALYTEPVDMLDGSHVFYAILQDKKTGAVSLPTSISYTFADSVVNENVTIVQGNDGQVEATNNDGSAYVPQNQYTPPASQPDYNPGGGGGGGYTPAPQPGPGDGGGSGGGEVTPDPGPSDGGGSGSGSGGGEVTPDPGPGDGGGSGSGSGGGEVTPDPGDGGGSGSGSGGGEVTPDPGPGEVTPDPGPSDGGEAAPAEAGE